MPPAVSAAASRYVEIRTDEARRRIFVYIGGQATGPQVWQALCGLFAGRPIATGYDMLFDIREYAGDVSAEDVRPIVEVYQRVRVPEADGTRTAFVTFDPNFGFWAEAMTYQFRGRLHRAFEDLRQAEAFLDEARASR